MRIETLSEAWKLRAASTFLQMEDLLVVCDEYIAQHISKGYAIQLFSHARQHKANLILNKVKRVIIKDPKFILSCPSLKQLDVDGLIDVIRLLDDAKPALIFSGIRNWGSAMTSEKFKDVFEKRLFPHVKWHDMPKKNLNEVVSMNLLRPELEHLVLKAMISRTKLDLEETKDRVECQIRLDFTCRHGSEACRCEVKGVDQLILQSTRDVQSLAETATGLRQATLNQKGLDELLKARSFSSAQGRVSVSVAKRKDDQEPFETVEGLRALVVSGSATVFLVLYFSPVQPMEKSMRLKVSFDMNLIQDFQNGKLVKSSVRPKISATRRVTDETITVHDWVSRLNGEVVAASAGSPQEEGGNNTGGSQLQSPADVCFVYTKVN